MVASQFRKKKHLTGIPTFFDTLEMLCGRASVKFSNGPDQNFTIFANFAIHNLALKVAFSTLFAKKRTNARKRTDWSLVPTQMRKTCVGYHFQDIDMLTAKLQTQIASDGERTLADERYFWNRGNRLYFILIFIKGGNVPLSLKMIWPRLKLTGPNWTRPTGTGTASVLISLSPSLVYAEPGRTLPSPGFCWV